MSTFLLNVPRTEILAMPLQYRTWVEFMYKILSNVSPPTKQIPGADTGSPEIIWHIILKRKTFQV